MEDLEERVSYLERETRRLHYYSDGLEKRTEAQFKALRSDIQGFKESVDKRFEHVYGELADLKADNAEMRNILATVVQRQEKQSELLIQHTELLKQILAKLS